MQPIEHPLINTFIKSAVDKKKTIQPGEMRIFGAILRLFYCVLQVS